MEIYVGIASETLTWGVSSDELEKINQDESFHRYLDEVENTIREEYPDAEVEVESIDHHCNKIETDENPDSEGFRIQRILEDVWDRQNFWVKAYTIGNYPNVGDKVSPIGSKGEWKVIETDYKPDNHNILVKNLETNKEMWISWDAIEEAE